MPRGSRDYGAEVGLRALTERGILRADAEGRFHPNPAETETIQFYANSIRHLMAPKIAKDSADVPELSAPAGS